MHTFLGIATAGITTLEVYEAWVLRRFTIVKTYHPIAGLLTFFLMAPIVIIGLLGLLKLKYNRGKDWEVTSGNWMVSLHRALAYILIFMSQLTVTLGLCIYYKQLLALNTGVTYSFVNFVAFWVILIFAEMCH